MPTDLGQATLVAELPSTLTAPLKADAAQALMVDDATARASLASIITFLDAMATLAETQPVSVAGLPLPAGAATQATLASVLAALDSVAVTGPVTDTQLRATALPVSGPLTDAQLRLTGVPVVNTLEQTALDALVARTSKAVSDFAAGRFRNGGGKQAVATSGSGYLSIRNPVGSPVNILITEFVLTTSIATDLEVWSDLTLTTPTARTAQMPNRAYEGFVPTYGVVEQATGATGGTQWSAITRLDANRQSVRAFTALIPPGKSVSVKALSTALNAFDLYASATWIEVPV